MAAAITSKETIGDLRNNLMKLTREIKRMKLSVDINLQGLSLGCPSAFLPILHASLMLYSLPLANWLTRQGYELYAKSDLRFIEGLYKVLRDVFHYRPRLSKEQFLSVGFTERKVILTTHVLLLSQAKHQQLSSKEETKRTTKKRSQRSNIHDEVSNPPSIVVRAVESGSPDPPTSTDLSGMPYNAAEESGMLEPTTHRYRYTSPTSSPVRGPSSDLELTPHPTPQHSQVSNTLTLPTKNLKNANLSTPVNTSHISATPVQTHTNMSPLPPPHTSTPSPCSSVGSSSTESESETENLAEDNPVVVVRDERGAEGEQMSVLLNISSRIDGLVRMVESMSARVDLVETHVKMVESMRTSTLTSQDQSTSTEFRDTSAHMSSGRDKSTSHSSPLHTRPPDSHHHTTRSPHHTSLTTTKSSSSSSKFTHTPSHYKDILSKPHPLQQTTPHSMSIHHSTPSTPEEACRLIESLRTRAKRTRDFLQQANSNSYCRP